MMPSSTFASGLMGSICVSVYDRLNYALVLRGYRVRSTTDIRRERNVLFGAKRAIQNGEHG
jgi:hypothetical protein